MDNKELLQQALDDARELLLKEGTAELLRSLYPEIAAMAEAGKEL